MDDEQTRGAAFAQRAGGGGATAGSAVGRAGAVAMRGAPTDMALAEEVLPCTLRQGGGFRGLTDDTARRTVTTVFDRLSLADDPGPSASAAGRIDVLDAPLTDRFGQGAGLYREGPKAAGEVALTQPPQFIAIPRERYDIGFKAPEAWVQDHDGAASTEPQPNRQDEILRGMKDALISLSEDVTMRAPSELMPQKLR
ncbi:gluconate 2-dehydrogenase subunit 3 family protein [Frigidibacter sp. MR17.14]|uniref:gluconate 2-dehydrogenase subunit 3 family protein n=1 Tax=Frigidibacter sp. MR17.14 TaxID=3126509 RepID=UPI003012CA55